MELNRPGKAIPEPAGIIIAKEETVAGIYGQPVITKDEILDLIMVSARITVGGRGPEEVAHLIDLAAGFVQRGAEDIARRGKTEHRERFVETLVGYPPSGRAGDPSADLFMGVIVSDAVAHNGNLCIGVGVYKPLGDRFEEFDPLLRRIQARRPVEQDRFGVDRKPGPLLEFDQIFPFGRDDIVFRTVFTDEVIASFRVDIPCRCVQDGLGCSALMLDPAPPGERLRGMIG